MRPSLDQFITFFYTNDLPATDHFYGDLLKLPLILEQSLCHIYQVSPDGFIGFCQAGTAVGRRVEKGDGIVITLVSREVDQWHDYLVAQNAAVEKPPTLNREYNIYHLFIRDPNGYLVEIQSFLDPLWPKPAAPGENS